MSLDLFLTIMAVVIVAIAVFLIISLIKLNRILENTHTLLTTLNETLPPVMVDVQNVSSNLNTLVGTVTNGVQQTASGLDQLRLLKMGTALEFIGFARKLLKTIRRLFKRREKNE